MTPDTDHQNSRNPRFRAASTIWWNRATPSRPSEPEAGSFLAHEIHIVMSLSPVVTHKDHPSPPSRRICSLLNCGETPGGDLMDQCSVARHPMSATSGPRDRSGARSINRDQRSRSLQYSPARQLNHHTSQTDQKKWWTPIRSLRGNSLSVTHLKHIPPPTETPPSSPQTPETRPTTPNHRHQTPNPTVNPLIHRRIQDKYECFRAGPPPIRQRGEHSPLKSNRFLAGPGSPCGSLPPRTYLSDAAPTLGGRPMYSAYYLSKDGVYDHYARLRTSVPHRATSCLGKQQLGSVLLLAQPIVAVHDSE